MQRGGLGRGFMETFMELRKQILGQHWNQDWTETSESLPMAHQSCVYRIRPRVSPRLAKAAQNGQA